MPNHNHDIAHMRSSRRISPLTDKEIDHEIKLLDHDSSMDAQAAKSLSAQSTNQTAALSASDQHIPRSESQAALTQHVSENGKLSNDGESEAGPSRAPGIEELPGDEIESLYPEESLDTIQSVSQKQSSRHSMNNRVPQIHPSTPKEPETEIDILYENQRGGFLCGIPLFSSAALGNLDPPAWTNFAHNPSPTDIYTAQVPDPSWEWAWPEWRINHDDQIQADGDGWEYSFMFSKWFSWHGPKWYNSCVRRRAWIRRRIKRDTGYEANDPHTMNSAYFTVTATKQERIPYVTVNVAERSSMDRQSRRSEEGPRRSREMSRGDEDSIQLPKKVVKTAEDLMIFLRQSRIDREKLEAVENYIENCTDDLLQLQECMHEIMSVFLFQASRQMLLARLTKLHDDVTSKARKGKSATTLRAEHLAEAIKHADEEVRRLEYWSDIKGMTEKGEAARAVDHQEGWGPRWQGLDKSGARGINEDKLP